MQSLQFTHPNPRTSPAGFSGSINANNQGYSGTGRPSVGGMVGGSIRFYIPFHFIHFILVFIYYNEIQKTSQYDEESQCQENQTAHSSPPPPPTENKTRWDASGSIRRRAFNIGNNVVSQSRLFN
jgi:hypothetical protein